MIAHSPDLVAATATRATWGTRHAAHLSAAALLSRPVLRLVPFPHALTGAAVGSVVLWLALRGTVTVESAVTTLRVVAVTLAISTAAVLDDPAAAVTTPVPQPRRSRWGLRILLLLPVIGVSWLLALRLAARAITDPAGAPVPASGLTLELAGLVAVTIAAAAVAERVGRGGGPVAGPTTLAIAVLLSRAPERAAFFPPPPPPGEAAHAVASLAWAAAHHRWLWLLMAAVAVSLWAGRDPGGPSWWARPHAPTVPPPGRSTTSHAREEPR